MPEPTQPTVKRWTGDLIDGRYAVDAEIGRGAMGRVVSARDLRLGRQVAIKLLPPGPHGVEQVSRFEQEARAAGSLNHPNVVVVHDIGSFEGSPYIVSELLHGTTLRERLERNPLPPATALDYAVQLVQGLRAAHEQGIVHRDLKPENLFVTREGRVKILDFGIAKLTGSGQRAGHETQEGAVMGTPSYMSPEQVRGDPADARSDIFACGSILHEMLSGVAPFDGATDFETGSAILERDPPPLPRGTPAALERVMRRCLEKDPELRFQSAAELAQALAAVPQSPRRRQRLLLVVAVLAVTATTALFVASRRKSPAVERTSIAVLPFANLSSDKENEYFSDGITEEVINALANVEGLQVASRTSAFAFKGRNLPVGSIAEQLKVSAVLEGSVRREGNSLRVTAQLIDGASGFHLWSHTFDRQLTAVFALEDELARSIAQTLQRRLVGAASPPTADVEAHDLYLKGRFFWEQRTLATLQKALDCFRQAIAKDPNYALAWAAVADTTILINEYGSPRPPRELLAEAKDAALKAVALGDSLSETHTALGIVSEHDYDWQRAEREYRRAIELRPDYATAHQWLGEVMAWTGRPREAEAELRAAIQLDPTSRIILVNACEIFVLARQYDRAIEMCNKALEMDPGYAGARSWLGEAYLAQGKPEAAIAELEKVPDFKIGTRGYAYAAVGRRSDAERLLTDLEAKARREWVAPVRAAMIRMGLGDKDGALASLQKACEGGDWLLPQVMALPFFDVVRGDPRFAAVLRCANLK